MDDSSKIINKYEKRINTGVILLLNSPKFMEFGIDNSIWTIGEKFMGMKLIPDGPHLIYYSLKDENYYFKQGFFINVNNKNKVHIRKWSPEVRDFINLKQEDEENFTVGVNNLDFDAYLGEYPNEISNWKDLTSFIDSDILQRLEPINKKYITSSKEYENTNSDLEIKGNIYFTNIPRKNINISLKNNNLNSHTQYTTTSEYLTSTNIDKSTILDNLLSKELNHNENFLLGEFQYSFVTFFLCEIYESFEQWKNIFILICSAEASLKKRITFFCNFIEIIYNMFRHFPQDFFHEQITANNFLGKLLEKFITNCKNNDEIHSQIKKRIKMLEIFLKDFFNFEIIDEEKKIINMYLDNVSNIEDDELPAIVDENEIQMILNYRHGQNNLDVMDVDTNCD